MRDLGRSVRPCVWVLALGAAACGALPEEPPSQEPPVSRPIDPRIDTGCLQEQLTPYVEAIGAGWPAAFRPTGSVLVSAAGQTLYTHGLGASDWAQRSANTDQTSFRIGSITKSFTAAAILQLAEAGRLALDDSIGELLPEYPAVGAGITLHQLLSHTAGLPNYTDDAALMARRDQPISLADLLASFWNQPLDFEPGSSFRYSNSGYVVLGAIIERVTGQTYAAHMQEAVFGPAGLSRTSVGDAEGLLDRALGYTGDGLGQLVPAFPIDMSVPHAAGAIRSTAADLARWHAVLGSDLLLGSESRELLKTPVLDGYAYGWFVSEQDGFEVVRHGGGIDGFLSDLVRVPELDLAVVVLLNAETMSPETISNAALRCALGQDIPPEPPPQPVALETSQRENLLGSYGITAEARQRLVSLGLPDSDIEGLASVEVEDVDGTLLLDPIGQDPGLMLPLSASDFLLPAAGATLRFAFADGEGLPATALTLEQGGLVLRYER
jgi:D-alanyl-D-alanine carboxypeptidase